MMKLGLFIAGSGHHSAAWRDPGTDPQAVLTFQHYAEMARVAERACFDLLFTADTNAVFGPDDVNVWSRTTGAVRLEPLTLLSGLAALTERIGLVSTATTTYLEPYHVARLFASLDQISQGREQGQRDDDRPYGDHKVLIALVSPQNRAEMKRPPLAQLFNFCAIIVMVRVKFT